MTTTNELLTNDDKKVFDILKKIRGEKNNLINLSELDIFLIFKEKKQYQIYNLDRPLDLVLNSEVK